MSTLQGVIVLLSQSKADGAQRSDGVGGEDWFTLSLSVSPTHFVLHLVTPFLIPSHSLFPLFLHCLFTVLHLVASLPSGMSFSIIFSQPASPFLTGAGVWTMAASTHPHSAVPAAVQPWSTRRAAKPSLVCK